MLSGTEWFRDHMENFVKPKLNGKIPNITMSEMYVHCLTPIYMSALRALWKEAKRRAGGKIILLPGRDVWWLEVLARMEGWPTVFKPEFSSAISLAVSHGYDVSPYKDMFCVDTGYRGSVPRALKCDSWALVTYNPDGSPAINARNSELSKKLAINKYVYSDELRAEQQEIQRLQKEYNRPHKEAHQLFPYRRDGYLSALPSWMEGSPKYWGRGEWNKDEKTLKCAPTGYDIFVERAAIITQHIVGVEYNTGRTVDEYYKKPKPVANIRAGGRSTQVPPKPAQGSAPSAPPDLGTFMQGSAGEVVSPVRPAPARPRHGRKLRVQANVPEHGVPVPEGTFGGFVNTEHSKSNSPYAGLSYNFNSSNSTKYVFWTSADTNYPTLPQSGGKEKDGGSTS